MQDDFRLCPLALLALQHVVRKVSRRDAEWLSVRLSFGLAGVLVRNDNHDLQRLADHLQRHQPGSVLTVSSSRRRGLTPWRPGTPGFVRLRLWAVPRALREHALGRRGSPPRAQWQHR